MSPVVESRLFTRFNRASFLPRRRYVNSVVHGNANLISRAGNVVFPSSPARHLTSFPSRRRNNAIIGRDIGRTLDDRLF